MGWQDDLARLYSAVPGPPVVAGTAPLVVAGGVVSMPAATSTSDGYMTAAQAAALEAGGGGGGSDYVTFNAVNAALANADATIDVNSQEITGLPEPSVPSGAATKGYVDSLLVPADVIDSHTLIRWLFDEASAPFANSGAGGACSLTGSPAATQWPMAGGTGVLCGGDLKNVSPAVATGLTTLSVHGRATIYEWPDGGAHLCIGLNKFSVRIPGSGSAWHWEVATKGVGDWVYTSPTSGRSLLRQGVEHHLGITLDDATHELCLYLDGALVQTATLGGSVGVATEYWCPALPYGAGTGAVRDWRIEDVVRTPAEMAQIWRAGR